MPPRSPYKHTPTPRLVVVQLWGQWERAGHVRALDRVGQGYRVTGFNSGVAGRLDASIAATGDHPIGLLVAATYAPYARLSCRATPCHALPPVAAIL